MTCPFCKFVINYTNIWGKICPNCDSFIPPDKEPEAIKINRIKMQELINEAKKSINKKYGIKEN